jgi:hypothetical protein
MKRKCTEQNTEEIFILLEVRQYQPEDVLTLENNPEITILGAYKQKSAAELVQKRMMIEIIEFEFNENYNPDNYVNRRNFTESVGMYPQ